MNEPNRDNGRVLTITEAAEALGVSVRTVQRRLDNGELKEVKEYGKRLVRLPADVSRDTTDDTPHDSSSGPIEAEVLASDVSHDATLDSGAYTTDTPRDRTRESTLAIPESNVLALLADVVTQRIREDQAQAKAQARPSVPVADKFLLTVAESAELAGLSSGAIRAAIKAGDLPALKGQWRGYRIRRGELETFTDGL
jgi:excisionase family DNA binding protein